jgi:hypothetical protein
MSAEIQLRRLPRQFFFLHYRERREKRVFG